MHENFENPTTCQALVDDYLECLHHRKYVSQSLAVLGVLSRVVLSLQL
jgi:hypothetical protein